MASFSVTQGPKADVAELEYIAALHQTCPATTRPTGTISSLDVARYLKSRLGLEISQTHARDIILALGGGSLPTDLRRQIAQRVAHESSAAAAAASTQSSTPKSRRQRWKEARSTHKASPLSVVDDETNEVEQAKLQTRTQQLIQELLAPKILYLDIVQMTSILLIPTFCRIQHDNELLKEEKASNPTNVKEGQTGEEKEVESWPANPATQSQNKSDNQDDDLSPQPSDLMEVVLQNLWAVGSGGREEDASVSSPPKLTPSLLKSFLEEVGEMERSNQTDLLQRMIQVAGGDGVVLDKATLLRALTADLQDWRVGCEDEESTYVQDVLGVDDPTALHSSFVRLGDANISGNRGKEPWNKQSTWKNEEDKSNIDLYVEDEEAGKGDLKQPELKEIGNVESDDKPDIQGKNDEDEDIVPVANMAMKGFVVVDQVIDVSASNVTLLLAWVTFIGHAGTWAPLILSLDPIQVECPASTFGCVLGGTIMNW